MNNKHGFTSFEFYFVMVVISLLVLVGIQRYYQMAEQVQRFSFELLAQHFSTAVYNARSQWFIRRQEKLTGNIVSLSDVNILMSEQGWPLSVLDKDVEIGTAMVLPQPLSVTSCHQLWLHLLHDPQPISFSGGDVFGTCPYHLLVTTAGECRYQLYLDNSNQYYFDYSPKTGKVISHSPAELRK